jgi:hypothetical protein
MRVGAFSIQAGVGKFIKNLVFKVEPKEMLANFRSKLENNNKKDLI